MYKWLFQQSSKGSELLVYNRTDIIGEFCIVGNNLLYKKAPITNLLRGEVIGANLRLNNNLQFDSVQLQNRFQADPRKQAFSSQQPEHG